MKDFLLDNAPGGYFLPSKGVEFVTKEKNLAKMPLNSVYLGGNGSIEKFLL